MTSSRHITYNETFARKDEKTTISQGRKNKSRKEEKEKQRKVKEGKNGRKKRGEEEEKESVDGWMDEWIICIYFKWRFEWYRFIGANKVGG